MSSQPTAQEPIRESPAFHSAYGHEVTRVWHQVPQVSPANLVYPIFVTDEAEDTLREIPALPGQFHIGLGKLSTVLDPLMSKGLHSVILFGVPTKLARDAEGSSADHPDTPVVKALKQLRKDYGNRLLLIADVCLCAYTEHGHCGVVRPTPHPQSETVEAACNGKDSMSTLLDADKSVHRMASVALAYAAAGAHVVAPSDMMDGRIGFMKALLAKNGFEHVPVMSYASKFASCFYGPFRSASGTALKGDRKGYQLPPGSKALAVRCAERDVKEGADYIMVKPGMPYLDVVAELRKRFDVPVAVYHVSGEYAMIWHAAQAGALDLEAAVMEAMLSFRRAGADIILTYYTPLVLEILSRR